VDDSNKNNRTDVESEEDHGEEQAHQLCPSHKDESGFVKTFPQRLFELLSAVSSETSECSTSIIWTSSNDAFMIVNECTFVEEVLPKYFKKTKFSSFKGKLYRWGFRRVSKGMNTGAYFHRLFLKDDPALCLHMRRQMNNSKSEDTGVSNSTASSLIPTNKPRRTSLKKQQAQLPKPTTVTPRNSITIPKVQEVVQQQKQVTTTNELHQLLFNQQQHQQQQQQQLESSLPSTNITVSPPLQPYQPVVNQQQQVAPYYNYYLNQIPNLQNTNTNSDSNTHVKNLNLSRIPPTNSAFISSKQSSQALLNAQQSYYAEQRLRSCTNTTTGITPTSTSDRSKQVTREEVRTKEIDVTNIDCDYSLNTTFSNTTSTTMQSTSYPSPQLQPKPQPQYYHPTEMANYNYPKELHNYTQMLQGGTGAFTGVMK